MRKIKRLGLLGTGVIGGGWAARALHAGIDVIASDINTKKEDRIQEAIKIASPSLNALTEGMDIPPKGKFTFTKDPIEMGKNSAATRVRIPNSSHSLTTVSNPCKLLQ